MGFLSGSGGGGTNPFSSDPFGGGGGGNDLSSMFGNMFDPTSFMGSFGDPLQQAQNTVSPPSNIDPSTGASTTPGGGSQSGDSQQQQPIAQALRQALDPNLRMQAGSGGNDIRRDGTPVQGASWIQPTAQSTPNPMFPQWTSPMDPSASGSPSYAGVTPGMTQAPSGRTPTMQTDQPPVPLPRPRPAEANAGDPSTSADVSLQGGGYGVQPSASPDPNESATVGMPTFPQVPKGTPPDLAEGNINVPVGGGATGGWTDSQPPQSSEIGRALGGTTQDPGTTAPAQPPTPAPSPSPAAVIPRDPTMQAGDGQQGSQGGQAGQGGQPPNPMQMLMDLLFGGPQALMQDLQGLARQVPGGYNYGNQQTEPNAGTDPSQAAPWLQSGGRAPAGTNPYAYPQATPEQQQQYRQTGTISPQSSKISGEKGPTPVKTARVPGPATATGTVPANTLPTTAGGQLDPFSTAAAGGGGIQGGTPFSTATGTGTDSRSLVANAPASDVSNPANQHIYDRALIQIESGGKRGQRTGSNYGLGQFSRDQWARYGLNASNIDDPATVSRALAMERRDQRPGLMRALGREPTAAEYYIGHQQGIAGGPALLQAAQNNPNTPAWQVLRPFYRNPNIAASAIRGNIPRDSPLRTVPVSQVTAKQFTDMWKQRYNREVARASGGRVQSFAGSDMFPPSATPSEALANRGYEQMPRWGQGVYGQFRRSGDVEDRRGQSFGTGVVGNAGNIDQRPWPSHVPEAGGSVIDPNDPMAVGLGIRSIGSRGPRRRNLRETTAGQS